MLSISTTTSAKSKSCSAVALFGLFPPRSEILNSVKFLNLTQSGCKKAEPSKTYHGIALTKCYGDYETKNKNIIKYLEGIF